MEFLDIASSRVEGECHTKHPPPVAVRRPIVDAYLRAFPRTPPMFRSDDAAMLAYAFGRAPAFGATVSVRPGTAKLDRSEKIRRGARHDRHLDSCAGRLRLVGGYADPPGRCVRPFRLAIDAPERDER